MVAPLERFGMGRDGETDKVKGERGKVKGKVSATLYKNRLCEESHPMSNLIPYLFYAILWQSTAEIIPH